MLISTASPRRRAIALSAVLCLVAAHGLGCGNEETKGSGPSKEDYDTAAKELKDGVGLISLYVPYLDPPKSEGKHDPRPTARDVQPRQERAANAIRMAAHALRQRGKSPVVKELADPLGKVAKDCTRAEGDEAVNKCKAAVSALDAALEKQAKAAADAGATSEIPRIGPDSATDESKKDFAPYLKALGPTPKEKETLKGLEDAEAKPGDLAVTCDAAAAEQKVIEETFRGVDEELRKLAVKHRFAIEAICRTLKRVEKSRLELKPCEELDRETDEKDWREKQCPLACKKAKGLVDEGMPAASQEDFPAYYKKVCVEDEE
jgi:hypothetical protein